MRISDLIYRLEDIQWSEGNLEIQKFDHVEGIFKLLQASDIFCESVEQVMKECDVKDASEKVSLFIE